jgi:hypothetical protein
VRNNSNRAPSSSFVSVGTSIGSVAFAQGKRRNSDARDGQQKQCVSHVHLGRVRAILPQSATSQQDRPLQKTNVEIPILAAWREFTVLSSCACPVPS